MDRSAGKRAHIGAPTFSLGLRHAAMSSETSRHGVQLELPRARLVQSAERLVFPDHSRGCYAHGGFVPDCVAAVWRVERRAAVHNYFPRHGRDPRHACLPALTRSDRVRLANLTNAPDLSADALLLHLESHPARD